MRFSIPSTVLRGIQFGLLIFGAVSSFAGAVIAIAANGGGMPLAYLEGSPFDSYLVPGLVLGLIVGGTQLAGAVGLVLRRNWALLASAVAGFGMLIWIFVEIAMIRQYSVLQTAYFALGGLEIILVLGMLGLVPKLVSGAATEIVRPGTHATD